MKGYIFDMDGTLLDSLDAWVNIGNRYLESLGLAPAPDLDEKLNHMALSDGSKYVKERFHLKETTDEIISGIRDLINNKYAYEIELKEGVRDFLQGCKEKQYKMCVLTASDSQLAKKAFQRLGVLEYFEDIYACHEIGLTKKDPQSYIEVAKKMQLLPQECTVVEDALYAIKTAKEAGFYVKAIYDKANQHEWDSISKEADESYYTFKDMKI